MTIYLVRSDRERKRTILARVGNQKDTIGLLYTDFDLTPGMRDITKEDIVDPRTGLIIGNINLFDKDNIISVRKKRKEISAFTKDNHYKESGSEVEHLELLGTKLRSRPDYGVLEKMGISRAHFLGKKSVLSHVFCFERDGEFSGLIYSRGEEQNGDIALTGLSLVLAQRIFNQEYLFDFIK